MAFQMDECGHRAATCMNYMPGFITPNTLCCLLHSDHCTWAQAIYLFDSDYVAHCHCCQISRTYLTFSRIFIKIQWFSTKLSISRVFLATLKKKVIRGHSRNFKVRGYSVNILSLSPFEMLLLGSFVSLCWFSFFFHVFIWWRIGFAFFLALALRIFQFLR